MAKKHKHEEHENHERWLVSYADFMTLLFAFFVVMYSVSRIDVKKVQETQNAIQWAMHFEGTGGVGAPPLFEGPPSEGGCASNIGVTKQAAARNQKAADAVRHRLEKRLRPFLMERSQPVTILQNEPGKLAIRLAATRFFDAGFAALRPEAVPVLDAVAGELFPLGLPIRVEGHTDDGTLSNLRFKNNWELSSARAATVAAYLEAAHHIAPQNLYAAGFASSKPVADNKTQEGREANRRIELVVEVSAGDSLLPATTNALPNR